MAVSLLPAVTGLTARFFGFYNATTQAYYYQVQAIYPDGRSPWALITINAPAGLNNADVIQLNWNSMPGSIGYDVVLTPTIAAPVGVATIGKSVGLTYPAYKDGGTALFPYTAIPPALPIAMGVAHAYYSFADDGGAVGTITPMISDLIPAGAYIYEAFAFVETALAGTSGGNVSIGIGATNVATLLANTAYGSVTGAIPLIPNTAFLTTPFQISAAGQITITVVTHALTAGVIEIFVRYYPCAAVHT